MTIPKTFSYDQEFVEEVIMAPSGGITGFEVNFIGLDIGEKQIQFTSTEGVLKEDGSGLSYASKERRHLPLSEQDATDFYIANKVVIDSLLKAAALKIADVSSKTGNVNE